MRQGLTTCGLRRASALIIGSLFLLAAVEAGAGITRATSVVVAGGVAPTPTLYESTLATMPDLGGSSITAGGIAESHLGTFDIVIDPSPALEGNAAALAAFNRAALQWEAYISDPITVTIDADFSLLGPGILGSTGSVFLQASYNAIRNAMVADAADEADDAIVSSLPTAAQFLGTVPTGFAFNGSITATKANLKAMGFAGLDGMFGVSDADIAFSTAFMFDFDRSDGITAGQFDFEGVAAHEIGHALGFVSVVDEIDFILPATSNQIQPMPLDLFRFRDGSANDPSSALTFTTAARDFVPGETDVFDQIDDSFGGDEEVLVATGVDFGDGRQASHWKDNLTLGIMDPTLATGELAVVRPNDLRAFDLIGYEISLVPEVGAALMLAAVGSLTGVMAVVRSSVASRRRVSDAS